MSVRQGNKIIAGQSASGVNLFDFKWADHQLDDMSWLRADTFSWHSGDVYVAAYEHLYSEYMEAGAHPDDNMFVDAVGDVSVIYWLTKDGHKICASGQESNVRAIYEKTGVAWYYLIDIYNKQFKLPRTKWGFVGLRGSLASYISAGVPDLFGELAFQDDDSLARVSVASGVFYKSRDSGGSFYAGKSGTGSVAGFSASRYNPIYGNSNTVQPPATQMYLYFYVGNFEHEALSQTAGLNAEMFDNKVDLPTGKTQSDVDIVIESQLPTAANSYTWYRKYKSGWVEQGGTLPNTSGWSNYTVTLPITMSNNSYFTVPEGVWTSSDTLGNLVLSKTTTQIQFHYYSKSASGYTTWEAKGMAA